MFVHKIIYSTWRGNSLANFDESWQANLSRALVVQWKNQPSRFYCCLVTGENLQNAYSTSKDRLPKLSPEDEFLSIMSSTACAQNKFLYSLILTLIFIQQPFEIWLKQVTFAAAHFYSSNQLQPDDGVCLSKHSEDLQCPCHSDMSPHYNLPPYCEYIPKTSVLYEL